MVILEGSIPRVWLNRSCGSVRGLWRSMRDMLPRFVRKIVGFEELAQGPIRGVP